MRWLRDFYLVIHKDNEILMEIHPLSWAQIFMFFFSLHWPSPQQSLRQNSFCIEKKLTWATRSVSTKSLVHSLAVYKEQLPPNVTYLLQSMKGKMVHSRTSQAVWRIIWRLLQSALTLVTRLVAGCASWPCLTTCFSKNFSIDEPSSWITSRRITFIATWNFSAILSYVNKCSLSNQKLINANMARSTL